MISFSYYKATYLVCKSQFTTQDSHLTLIKGLEVLEVDELIKSLVDEYKLVIPSKYFRCQYEFIDNSHSGQYQYGSFFKKTGDVSDLELSGDAVLLQLDLIDELQKNKDDNGLYPYRISLEFNQSAKYKYKLTYPDLNFDDLSQVEKSRSGFHPNYIYINLNDNLINQLDEFNLNQMIPLHIEEARKILNYGSDIDYTKSISNEFYLFMINMRVDSEINNGTFDQMYNLFSDTGSEIIIDIYHSFKLLNNAGWLSLFTESIQLYSHFHDNVNNAREKLNISRVEKSSESDIMSRFYKLEPTLDSLRATFIRSNLDKFITTVVN